MNKLIFFITVELFSVVVFAASNDNGISSDASRLVRSNLAIDAYTTMCSAFTNNINEHSVKLASIINARDIMLESNDALDKEFSYALTSAFSLLLTNLALKNLEEECEPVSTNTGVIDSKKNILSLWRLNANFNNKKFLNDAILFGDVFTIDEIISGKVFLKIAFENRRTFRESFEVFRTWLVFGNVPSQEEMVSHFMSVFQDIRDLQYFMAAYEKDILILQKTKFDALFMNISLPSSIRIDDGITDAPIEVLSTINRYCIYFKDKNVNERVLMSFTLALGPFMLNRDSLSDNGRRALRVLDKDNSR